MMREYVKVITFGGLDGIITTFAVVSSVVGMNAGAGLVLAAGLANIFADAFSMGFGEYLSSSAEEETVRHEYAKEKWELENYPAGERLEMVELYEGKGMTSEDAELVVDTMMDYPKFFLDVMMVEELGYLPPDDTDDDTDDDGEGGTETTTASSSGRKINYESLKSSGVMFGSFVVFGFVPLVAFIAVDAADRGNSFSFGMACLITGFALFALGVLKARATDTPALQSGALMLLVGALAAGASFLIGWGLSAALETDC